MFKNKWITLIVAVVIILALVVSLIFLARGSDDYYVVYLASGEVYVGKLAVFPSLQLRDAYSLQVTKDDKDPTKNNFNLNPVKDAVWAPAKLHLNKNQVVFYGPLESSGKIAQVLADREK
jgi:hypothetical protein